MIAGLGIDLVELDRIQDSWERFGRRFAEKILAPGELAALPEKNPVPFLAARFAAKEAAAKALGTGFARGVTLRDIEVRSRASGKPELVLTGTAREIAREMGVDSMHVSLTHARDTAGAMVIFES